MIRSLAILLCVVAFAGLAHAQNSDIGYARELDLTLAPEYPAPGDTVRLSVKTSALDLNRSMVLWYVNEKEVARGAGLTETTITAGSAGSVLGIRVVAEDPEGLLASAETTIRPAEVDLIWEATSYVPPFYEGRILPGNGSPIRLQALARFRSQSGSLIPERDIVYSWYHNDTLVTEGRGRSAVTLPGPTLFGTDTFRVTAASADEVFSGGASVRIPSVDPFPILYENHPLFGILFHRALEGSTNTLETEEQLTAVPYFANVSSLSDSSLSYEWRVANTAIPSDKDEPQTLTLTANGYSGPLDIELSLMSARDIAMHATGKWQLVFGGENSIFGNRNPFGTNE